MENDKKHRTTINKIESLLGIEITNIADYFEFDSYEESSIDLKDKLLLANEQREINKRLSELFNNGIINNEDYIEMKQAILIEYSDMIKNAPERVIEKEYVQEQEHCMSM